MRSIAGYVRRHHVGLLALFIALGGTAYAVQNAPKDSVVSRSIKNGQVKPQDVKLAKTREYPALVTLSPFSVETLDPLPVKVPKSGMVSVYAQSEIKKTSGPADGICVVSLRTVASGIFEGLYRRTSFTSEFIVRRTAPGTAGIGVSDPSEAGLIAYNLEPGRHEFELNYAADAGTNCQFRNTKLVVVPLP
jgi:hypothetical protein